MITIKKIKAVGGGAPAALVTHFSKHDTSVSNQWEIVLEALVTGPKSSIQLKDEYGVMAPAARIAELRKLGYKIATIRVRAHTKDGVLHRGVALYILLPGGHPTNGTIVTGKHFPLEKAKSCTG